MESSEQLGVLERMDGTMPFARKLEEIGRSELKAAGIQVFQMNVGRTCNLRCKHCHVSAGPERTEQMPREVFEQCLAVVRKYPVPCIDVTGGAPEMNPHLEWFLDEAGKLGRRLLVRSNLVILGDPAFAKFLDVYTRNKVEIVTSLPDYNESKSDRQRGAGTFKAIINVIRELNSRGYGKPGSGLILDMVHNPVGAYLPGSQDALAHEYRARLRELAGIEFNNLFCLTNVPVGRYLEYLVRTDNYDDYICELVNAFNPAAVDNVMCRTTLSVGFDGTLYDCDFNQMLDLPVGDGAPQHIAAFDMEKLTERRTVVRNHCYGCVAGAGSSCQGETT